MHITKYLSLILLFLAYNAYAQNRNWTVKTTKNGKSTVKYELVKEGKQTHFYYIAQTKVNTPLDKLDDYFSNTANHKKFLERTTITEEIEKISDNEWLSYYFFNAPWPLQNSDIVIKINRYKEENKLIFTANAVANNYKKSDVKRMTNYKVIYEFEKINDTTTKITYNADYVPIGSIPKFIIKSWFPEGPANIVNNLGIMK